MSTEANLPPTLAADYQKWKAKKDAEKAASEASGKTFDEVRANMISMLESLPEHVEIPYHLTPEGERWTKFKNVCDDQFLAKIDYAKVKSRTPFDRMADWDGTFPGPCGHGPTDMGKSRAAWWALRRLYVRENKPFAWFPVRRLITELARYEKNDCADEFFRTYDFYKILFVDDIDKINWDFDSQTQLLFSFFDWVYRSQKPCIVTTNKDRAWWTDKMGDAFARRLFEDACTEVKF